MKPGTASAAGRSGQELEGPPAAMYNRVSRAPVLPGNVVNEQSRGLSERRVTQMKAVLLVGGEGTRLRPLTCNTVKAMVPILNQPFFAHLLAYLASHGVDDIVVTLCYLPDRIGSRFADGRSWGVTLTYVMEETPLGTAGAVKNAEQHLDGDFFVFNGDIITNIDLRAMLAFHRRKQAVATIALTPVEDPSAYGVVDTGPDGRVRRFIEKPPRDQAPTNMINAGIYVLDASVLRGVPQGRQCMFERQVFPDLLAAGAPVYAFPTTDYWIDIGTPEKYRQVQYDLLQGRCSSQLEDAGPGVGASLHIDPTAAVEGQVRFGHHCSVGAGARILGPTVLGDGCTVLDGATVDRSIVWKGARVGRGAAVRECVIGERTSIGDGAVVEAAAVLGDSVVITPGACVKAGQKIWPDTTV